MITVAERVPGEVVLFDYDILRYSYGSDGGVSFSVSNAREMDKVVGAFTHPTMGYRIIGHLESGGGYVRVVPGEAAESLSSLAEEYTRALQRMGRNDER